MAEYNIRRDNLISPWGVGAIVPFPHDESLMVAGLDFWFDEDHPINDFIIHDERLEKRLGGTHFVEPPDYRTHKEDPEHPYMKIPAVRFPLWHYCPVCGNMEKIGMSGSRKRCSGKSRRRDGKETYCSERQENKRPYLIPERFVAVCENGHIEDFPVMEWVHVNSNKPIGDNCKLVRSTGGASSSLAGIKYTCTCGASATMKDAFYKGALDRINYTCTGNRPWLGLDNNELCGKSLSVLQRGASNVWFADIISSIYIPWIPKYKNEATKDCIARGINKFKSQRVNGEIDYDSIRQFVDANKNFVDEDIDADEAYAEIVETINNANKDGTELTEDEYRQQEFEVLTRNAGKASSELFVKNYPISEYNGLDFLKSVSLVHKMRETRVFTGFKRLKPDQEKSASISISKPKWLPAVKNSGEGIMIEFDYKKLIEWEKRADVVTRVRLIENNLKSSQKLSEEELNPIFILLHTFSHCVITALANESGYSNASIREKIYCPKYKTENIKNAGVLIYTASGDSEGSLGGLVRQGLPGKFEAIIRNALNDAVWCASDPVCIQSQGQGQDGCNLAACHNCALLPETSCENKNMLLDRGLMVGTLEDFDVGFFKVE